MAWHPPTRIEGVRVLVCGGRDYPVQAAERWLWREAADEIGAALGLSAWNLGTVIHGGARGADAAAGRWAEWEGVPVAVYLADWSLHRRAAGPIRNARMLAEGRPDVVIAFPGGAGTEDMVRKARAAGVPVIEVEAGRGEDG